MAAKPTEPQDSDMLCSVCMETYTNPKILPCFHTFCRGCLQNILDSTSSPTKGQDSTALEQGPADEDACSSISSEYQTNIDIDTDVISDDDLCEPLPTIFPPDDQFELLRHPLDQPTDTPVLALAEPAKLSFPCSRANNVSKPPFSWLRPPPEFPSPSPVSLKCPVCKTSHNMPKGGVEELQDDYSIVEKIELLSLDDSHSTDNSQCVLCSEMGVVTEYCKDCCGFLCDSCSPSHKRMKQFSGHIVVPAEQTGPEHYLGSMKGNFLCEKHLANSEVFCEDCQKFLCIKCVTTGEHSSHKLGMVLESDMKYLRKAAESKASCSSVLEQFRSHKDYIKRVESDILKSDHFEELKKEINRKYDYLGTVLEKQRKKLLSQADDTCNSLKKRIWTDVEFVDSKILAMESAIGFADKAKNVRSSRERIKMNLQAIKSMDFLARTTWSASFIDPPQVIKSQPLPSLDKIVCFTDPKFDIEYDNLVICNPTLLIVKFEESTITRPQIQLLYGKKEQLLDETQVFLYEGEEENCYNVEFVPRVAGKHILSVSICGVSIGRKEFEVTGKPKYGNQVQCGPDWMGEPKSLAGVINSISRGVSSKPTVTVEWADGDKSSHEWGRDGRFEIEILPIYS